MLNRACQSAKTRIFTGGLGCDLVFLFTLYIPAVNAGVFSYNFYLIRLVNWALGSV